MKPSHPTFLNYCNHIILFLFTTKVFRLYSLLLVLLFLTYICQFALDHHNLLELLLPLHQWSPWCFTAIQWLVGTSLIWPICMHYQRRSLFPVWHTVLYILQHTSSGVFFTTHSQFPFWFFQHLQALDSPELNFHTSSLLFTVNALICMTLWILNTKYAETN